jgi:hypothetical protein
MMPTLNVIGRGGWRNACAPTLPAVDHDAVAPGLH